MELPITVRRNVLARKCYQHRSFCGGRPRTPHPCFSQCVRVPELAARADRQAPTGAGWGNARAATSCCRRTRRRRTGGPGRPPSAARSGSTTHRPAEAATEEPEAATEPAEAAPTADPCAASDYPASRQPPGYNSHAKAAVHPAHHPSPAVSCGRGRDPAPGTSGASRTDTAPQAEAPSEPSLEPSGGRPHRGSAQTRPYSPTFGSIRAPKMILGALWVFAGG